MVYEKRRIKTAFNSLFEMRLDPALLRGGRLKPFNSLFEMRRRAVHICSRPGAPFNSLFEMRNACLSHASSMTVASSFNSLFEML